MVSSMREAAASRTGWIDMRQEAPEEVLKLVELRSLFEAIREEASGRTLRSSGARVIANNWRRIKELLNEIGGMDVRSVMDLTTPTRPLCETIPDISNGTTLNWYLRQTVQQLDELIDPRPDENQIVPIKTFSKIGRDKVLEVILGRFCRITIL